MHNSIMAEKEQFFFSELMDQWNKNVLRNFCSEHIVPNCFQRSTNNLMITVKKKKTIVKIHKCLQIYTVTELHNHCDKNVDYKNSAWQHMLSLLFNISQVLETFELLKNYFVNGLKCSIMILNILKSFPNLACILLKISCTSLISILNNWGTKETQPLCFQQIET